MAAPSGRFSQLRWLHNTACVLALIGSFVLIGLGLAGMGGSASTWMVVVGCLAMFLAVAAMTVMPILLKMESTLNRQLGELRDVHDRMASWGKTLDAIAENTRISDAAKSLARREQEMDAFRLAIQEDFRLEKWEAALRLVDEIESRFGYKQEADALREDLDEARSASIQAKLNQAIAVIEEHFKANDWDRAQVEIDRLLQALPDDTRVASLVERKKALREHHKQSLLQSWDEAVRRSDVDNAIDILKELDQYLSPAEAESLQTAARDVFKEKLLQLGVKFRFAVTEKRWEDALATGLELVEEFPNARMASEVREALDTLRERARQQQEAPAGAPGASA